MTTVKKKVPEAKPMEGRPSLTNVLNMLRTNDNGNRWNPARSVRFWISPTEERVVASVYLDDAGCICVDLEDVLDPDETETAAEEKARVEQAPLQSAEERAGVGAKA